MRNIELYIHIPFCVRKCAYCDFLSFPVEGGDIQEPERAYVNALMREIRYYGEQMKDVELSTIYIGGGTPSLLEADEMEAMMNTVYGSFAVAKDAEISMECNPGTANRQKLLAYRACGINRISIGLQSASDKELKTLGRIHTFAQFLQIYQEARQAGFDNINIDLMSGIPFQTPEQFHKSLSTVVRLRPEHISAYSLIVEEKTPFYEKYHEDVLRQGAGEPTEALPSEEQVCQMLEDTEAFLEAHGYRRYEISNYAREGYACRHNLGYWERTEYLGVGLGAASLIGEARYTNTRNLEEYLRGAQHIHRIISEEPLPDRQSRTESDPESTKDLCRTNLHTEAAALSRHDQMAEFMYLGLRKTDGIARTDFEEAFGISIDAIYPEQIRKLIREGLLVQQEGRIMLTPKGLRIANYAMAEFV